jgi:hypothetical protein
MTPKNTKLTKTQTEELLAVLKLRFEKNPQRHPNIAWKEIEIKLRANADKLWSLSQMEHTGGEPDVVALEPLSKEITFYDCSTESPKNRRSLCYDDEALLARKENKPADSAMNLAENMGLRLLTEQEYRYLQTLGEFDLKTSSWIQTPQEIRKLNGALFCDRRYNQVFVYHNGAESYYAARGFRAVLRV